MDLLVVVFLLLRVKNQGVETPIGLQCKQLHYKGRCTMCVGVCLQLCFNAEKVCFQVLMRMEFLISWSGATLYFALSNLFHLKGCVRILVDYNSILKLKQYH